MKNFVSTGKRKRAIAKAVINAGKGTVTINNISIQAVTPKIARMKMQEAIAIAGDHASKVDIKVNVNGGGFASQADAVRLAIAKAFVGFVKDKKLEKEYLDYDRNMLVADVRRKEVRKPNRHGKARSKTQKSYR